MPNDDTAGLRRYHQATLGLLIALLICAPLAWIAIAVFEVSEEVRVNLLGTIFGTAIVILLLHFAKRCPACRASLGRQAFFVIPQRCRNCGKDLREE